MAKWQPYLSINNGQEKYNYKLKKYFTNSY